jgi:predicted dehydrogenase
MLNNEDLDVVDILLPNRLHEEVTSYAAEKKVKGISVQKPMALTLEEADRMIKACKNSGSKLSIYENFAFIPDIKKAKELIEQDYIGDISSIRIKIAIDYEEGKKLPENVSLSGEGPKEVQDRPNRSSLLLSNIGWRAFSLGWWLFGEDFEKVFAWTGNYHGIDAPAYVMWKCKRNKDREYVVPQYGSLEFSLTPEMNRSSNYFNNDEFIEIIGSRGIMKINHGTSVGNKMSDSVIFSPVVVIRDGKVETFSKFEKDLKFSFIDATKYFVEVVKGNKVPIISGEQARHILIFSLAAFKSAEIRKEIYLDDFN